MSKDQQLAKQKPEATAVITVRLPVSVHAALKSEAHRHETSLNKLCISKLLQPLQQPS